MPTVPQEYAPYATVAPQGQLQPNNLDRPTPADFGGQVGQALDQAGNMLEQHAVQRQQIINAANVDDVYANKFDPAARQKYMDFLSLKGKDAEAAFPQVQKDLQDLLTETANSLPNPMQRHQFQEVARRRLMSDMDGMARHAAAETNSWINQTTDATGGVYMNRIVDTRNDPNAVAGLVQNINNLYASRGQYTGQDSVVYKTQAAHTVDAGIQKAVQADLERDDPESAQNTFDNYSKYLSGDAVKSSIQSSITPALERSQVNAVTTDLYGKYNPNDPSVNPNTVAAFIRDPKNYPQIGEAQRTSVLNNFLGDRNRAEQVQSEKQSGADNAFIDAINKNQIGNTSQFNAWTDPTTGLPASPKLVQSAIERSTKSATKNTEENSQTILDLSDGVANRRITDPAPINDAYLKGDISDGKRKELLNLQDLTAHPEKTPWFSQAEQLYQQRYDAKNADAVTMYPQFISQLKQAVLDQNLHGQQIIDTANKMLEPVDKAIISHHFFGEDTYESQPALDFAKKWGGFAVPNMNAIGRETLTQTGVRPPPPGQTESSPMEPEAVAWIRKAWGSNPHEQNDTNIRAAYDQLKAQDPNFYKHWKIGD